MMNGIFGSMFVCVMGCTCTGSLPFIENLHVVLYCRKSESSLGELTKDTQSFSEDRVREERTRDRVDNYGFS